MSGRDDPAGPGAGRAWFQEPPSEQSLAEWLEVVRAALEARAAGIWWVDPDATLRSVADAFHPELPAAVAEGFRLAAAVVSLADPDLSIAQAARDRSVVVATVGAGPPGSRHWLGRFGAVQSIAVPILRGPDCWGVLSIAVPNEWSPDREELRRLEEAARALGRVSGE